MHSLNWEMEKRRKILRYNLLVLFEEWTKFFFICIYIYLYIYIYSIKHGQAKLKTIYDLISCKKKYWRNRIWLCICNITCMPRISYIEGIYNLFYKVSSSSALFEICLAVHAVSFHIPCISCLPNTGSQMLTAHEDPVITLKRPVSVISYLVEKVATFEKLNSQPVRFGSYPQLFPFKLFRQITS